MNALLPTLQFLRPWWLLALFALPLLVWAWRARQRRRSAWRDVVDPHLLPHLLESGGERGARAPWLALAVLASAILALAGPSWRQRAQPLWQTRAPLVVAPRTAMITDVDVAAHPVIAAVRSVEDMLANDFAKCHLVSREDVRGRPPLQRFISQAARLLSPVL